jgi:hypothetical protein
MLRALNRLRATGGPAFGLVRWWFGFTYLVAGVGCVIAGPIMIGTGNYGGVYMIVGGAMIAAAGWFVHPWGFGRGRTTSSTEALRR